MNYDENEHTKEVFAHFGLAMYLSGVVEAALAHALMGLDFLTKQKEKLPKLADNDFDLESYQAEFDKFFEAQYAQTLGNLIKRFRKFAHSDASLEDALAKTKAQRDFLAHHYFRDRAEKFVTRKGRDVMIAELEEAQALFSDTERQIAAYAKSVFTKLGMPVQVMEDYARDYANTAKAG